MVWQDHNQRRHNLTRLVALVLVGSFLYRRFHPLYPQSQNRDFLSSLFRHSIHFFLVFMWGGTALLVEAEQRSGSIRFPDLLAPVAQTPPKASPRGQLVESPFQTTQSRLGVLSETGALHSVPLSRPQPSSSARLFEAIPGTVTGIDLIHQFPSNAPFALLTDQASGCGVCIGDYDGDGLPDIFITNYDRGNRLYRNLGQWRFTDVTPQAGVRGEGRWSTGATFVDIDKDGDLDLYVCVYNAPNLLFLNQGDGTFREQAQVAHLDFRGASVMMAFADYDGDGHLDAYLLTHRLNVGSAHFLPRSSKEAFSRAVVRVTRAGQVQVNPEFQELFATMDKGSGRTELIIAGQPDFLCQNQGKGIFVVANHTANIRGNDIGLAATWWDYNQDGFPDLYVSNDYRGPDRLYRNDGRGSFAEVAGTVLPHVPWASMGADIADINNDGYVDLFAADMSGSTHERRQLSMVNLAKDRWFLESGLPRQYPRNALFLGTGTEHLMEAAYLAGVADTDWTWSPKFADLDNDGWMDLFLTTGMSRDFVHNDLLATLRERGVSWRHTPILRQTNLVYRNLGDLQFKNVSLDWGLNALSASYGAAFADLDRDGDLDLLVTNFGEPVSVYRNTGTQGHRVLIRLKGRQSNAWGIGATVRVTTPAGVQTKILTSCSGFASSNEPLLHFGLGQHTEIDRLTVVWPGGHHQSFHHLAGNQFYTITEAVPADPPSSEIVPSPWFFPARAIADLRHREQPFDDFQHQPLLPWKLSRFGPGLAVGDANGDGWEDLYLGGAAGQSGMLALLNSAGHFRIIPTPSFEDDRASEDAGACFLDVDGDGDLDLYVVSGGVECEREDALLQDRLYLNDGQGNFSKAPPQWLPVERDSGSVVAAADFDRDGDLDLFVGGRSLPGHYPQTPQNHLLRNDLDQLSTVTGTLAPDLRQTGLVTSALWSDVNGDGWIDLMLTHEWGPIQLFVNQQGHLKEQTQATGLNHLLGLWNGIAAGDIDEDGDMDYVISNFGLNTRYRATLEYPVRLYAGQFDDSGERHLVEAYYENGRLLPIRGKSCIAAAMPSLAARFPTFKSYAEASLIDIYPPQMLAKAQCLQVNTLESGILFNDGSGHFQFRPLPRLAQIAPTFGIVLTDVDADGHTDLCLAQNFFSPQPETGRMDGGLGLLLKGDGRGHFQPLPPKASGFIVPGDAKSLVVNDLNNDLWPDIIAGINDNEPVVLLNRGVPSNRLFQVRLQGRPGNPNAIGARVSLTLTNGSTHLAEVSAGGGYLSQSSSTLTFGLGAKNHVQAILVRWPNGKVTSEYSFTNPQRIVLKEIPE